MIPGWPQRVWLSSGPVLATVADVGAASLVGFEPTVEAVTILDPAPLDAAVSSAAGAAMRISPSSASAAAPTATSSMQAALRSAR